MKIILNKWEEQEAAETAESYGIDKDKLLDCYRDVMRSNFHQDLCDIALENEEELKGHDE